MVRIVLTASLVLVLATTVLGQPASRIEVGPVVRLEQVFIEGDATGTTAVAGVAAGVRISRRYGVEGELTSAWNRIENSYEGWFSSYAEGPDLTREEIERLAPYRSGERSDTRRGSARRSRSWPGVTSHRASPFTPASAVRRAAMSRRRPSRS